jgi:hypothetical protein
MLIAKEGYNLTQDMLGSQFNHVKDMALGNNSIPFRYGHFTNNKKYPLDEKLIHGDSFGTYFRNGTQETIQKYSEGIFYLNPNTVIGNASNPTDVSFMHARLVTLGSKDISNAQPLVLENIVGSHNGTVEGLESGGNSDSKYILGVLNGYFRRHTSEIDVASLEDSIVQNIVEPSTNYLSMNLMMHVKHLDKVVVLCSYDENRVKTREHEKYYNMTIASNDSCVYVSSEDDYGQVTGSAEKIQTRNHTLYVIDRKTGKIEVYHLSNLEAAVNAKLAAQNRVKESPETNSVYEIFYVIDGETRERTEYNVSKLRERRDHSKEENEEQPAREEISNENIEENCEKGMSTEECAEKAA